MGAPATNATPTIEWLEDRYPALVAFFRQRLPVSLHNDIHDLTQDTLIAVWKVWSRAEETIRDPLSYLFQVARNKCNDAHRERGRKKEVPVDDVENDVVRRLRSIGVEEELLEKERREETRRALARLSPREYEVLYLRYYEQLGNREASEHLGIDPEECSRIKYRALARLRSRLDLGFRKRMNRIMRLLT